MVEPDNLRFTRIPLNNGSGAIPALGFGTLIPDPVATRVATKALLEDPVIAAIAKRVNKTPAQVLLAWAIQRGTALLTTSTNAGHIKENFEVSAIPEDAVMEITEGIKARVRFNSVVETGVPGFIPRGK